LLNVYYLKVNKTYLYLPKTALMTASKAGWLAYMHTYAEGN